VELRYKVDVDGKVSEVRVVPSPNANVAFDDAIAAAKDVALSCVYEPAMQGGQPVATTVSRWFTVPTAEAR
jgi:outer membrane biosynthesis protein TonB